MIARERLRTSRMRSCFRSILVAPVADAGPAGLLWLSPDIETAPHLLGVLKHSRKRDAIQPMRYETPKNSTGKASSRIISDCQRIFTQAAIESSRDTKFA